LRPNLRGDTPLTRRALVRGIAASLLVGGAGLVNSNSVFGASLGIEPARPDPGKGPLAHPTPAWFLRDVQRKARWLPDPVREFGIEAAYRQRLNAFPDDVKNILGKMAIPPWLIALVPTAAFQQAEIEKQFRFMAYLAGPPPANPVAVRAEQLLIFGGAAQLPTPGDRASGASLGPEGCAAAMSRYVLAQLKLEFPRELARMGDALANSQSSVEMKGLLLQAAKTGVVQMRSKPFAQLRPEDIRPGSLTIAQKPGGTHVFGWTRVPAAWDWSPGDKMAIGNTGLVQFGDRMILAQEYVTASPAESGELAHNQHGPINSRNVVYIHGAPDLADPRTNVYAARGSDFILIDLA
jgi:hypothetical protein